MKKFIFCVVAGYILVFILFIGLPQMMGGRGGTLTPKGIQEPQPLAERPLAKSGIESGVLRKEGVSYQTIELAQPVPAQKPLNQYESGPVETFYRNGTLSSEWILDAEGSGIFKTYTADGHPWMSVPIMNNVLEGELKNFYSEGPLFSSENYSLGERRGTMIWWYKNGNPWLKIAWSSDGKGLLEALYSEDGKLADFPAVQADQGTSYFKAFDEFGHEVINLQQSGGEQNLILKSYYQNGSTSAEISLQGKMLHGREVRYYPDGTIWMERNWLSGHPDAATVFYPQSKVVAFAEMPMSVPQDGLEWKAYYPDGKIFWQLTKLVNPDQTLAFHLTTHWQDETPTDTAKERVIL